MALLVTHTVTVFALGVATLLASQYVVLDQVYSILGALSGVAICLVGLKLLAVRVGFGYHHDHDHHHHDHSHHDYHHPEDWRSLVAIGISGGMVPCPSALVLLISAMAEGRSLTIALHQITYGLVLVGGFSLGLASVLTALGLMAIYGRQWLERSPIGKGTMQRLSVISALATICIGLGLTTVAVVG